MSLRIFSVGLCALVTSCGGPPESVAPADPTNAVQGGTGTPAGDPVERIACALGEQPLAAVCTVDRATDRDGTLLTIRHPDGGFRRLRVAPDGTVRAADGAVDARVTTRGDVADVAIGGARYQLPLASR